ncbi:MAG: hypothetical protein GY711_18465 [bacterium]|nr:hypothetical protein [bacterium]
MQSPHVPILVLALAAPLAFPGCVTETESASRYGITTERSYGSVVTGDLDTVWSVTQSTLRSLGEAFQADGSARRAEATVSGARVSITCEPYDASRTILRIGATQDGEERPEVAEEVQMRIQRNLMR